MPVALSDCTTWRWFLAQRPWPHLLTAGYAMPAFVGGHLSIERLDGLSGM